MFSKKTHTEFNKIFNEEKFLFFKKISNIIESGTEA